MRRQITYSPEFQLIVVLFNANANIISLASTINKWAHIDLTYTGELGSYDTAMSMEFKFDTFSDENKLSKITVFLLKNKAEAVIQKSTSDLFAEEEMSIQRYLIGNKSSIYNHRNLISSDYCFIVSYPSGQPKPMDLLEKIKKMDIVNTTIELKSEDFQMFKNLSEEIELYINDYNFNIKSKLTDLSKNRKKILLERSAGIKKPVEDINRIVFPNL